MPKCQDPANWINNLDAFDAQSELDFIRETILQNHRRIMGTFRCSDHLDDLVMECFLHFWENNTYKLYNPNKGTYNGFRAVAIRNFMINRHALQEERYDRTNASLDKAITLGGATHNLHSMLPSYAFEPSRVLEAEELRRRWDAVVLQMDNTGMGTGLPELSYRDIFEHLLTGESKRELHAKTVYTRRTVDSHVDKLRANLRAVSPSTHPPLSKGYWQEDGSYDFKSHGEMPPSVPLESIYDFSYPAVQLELFADAV